MVRNIDELSFEELREKLEEIHEKVLASGSITDKVQCPGCGSTHVSWSGGDMSGLGDYYDMYMCEECGRLPKSVQVFLVPVSNEDYGTHPSNRTLRETKKT